MQPSCQTTNRSLGRTASLLVLIVAHCAGYCGCAPSNQSTEDIHVLVAASAKDATEQAVDAFLRRTPKADQPKVIIASGASSSLAQQIRSGAPASIFISANPVWSEAVAEEGVVYNFLTNRLILATPKSNQQHIGSIDDLVAPHVKTVAIAGEGVPVGDYATQAIEQLSESQQKLLVPKLVFAKDSSALVAWLESDEVDAGFVYASDLKRSSNLNLVQRFDESMHNPIEYSIAMLEDRDSANWKRCTQLLAWLKSDEGQAIYRDAGFESLNSP